MHSKTGTATMTQNEKYLPNRSLPENIFKNKNEEYTVFQKMETCKYIIKNIRNHQPNML